ncbi:MAG: hypothetical protein U0670_13070 [Anaerolineae bacterium]
MTTIPPTETPPPVWVNAVYLGFEHGFMAYVEGASCLYAFAQSGSWNGIVVPAVISAQDMGVYRYCTEFAALPDAPTGAPEGYFGRVWSYYAEMQTALGSPTGTIVRYATTMPPSEPVVMGAYLLFRHDHPTGRANALLRHIARRRERCNWSPRARILIADPKRQ